MKIVEDFKEKTPNSRDVYANSFSDSLQSKLLMSN